MKPKMKQSHTFFHVIYHEGISMKKKKNVFFIYRHQAFIWMSKQDILTALTAVSALQEEIMFSL